MKIRVKNQDAKLSKHQEDLINNVSISESEVRTRASLSLMKKTMNATKAIGETIEFLLNTPKRMAKLKRELPENFGVESDLYDLGAIINRLKQKGVDRRIISDTLINSMSYTELNYLASDIDSFLRSYKF